MWPAAQDDGHARWRVAFHRQPSSALTSIMSRSSARLRKKLHTDSVKLDRNVTRCADYCDETLVHGCTGYLEPSVRKNLIASSATFALSSALYRLRCLTMSSSSGAYFLIQLFYLIALSSFWVPSYNDRQPQDWATLGGQLGALIPNCWAYSALSRCQPNFIASLPTMRPIGVPLSR